MCANKRWGIIGARGSIRGFSLVELLVVIGILAVMAALLFPVLQSARASAKKANCSSNEKQIHFALISYSDDNRGTLPPSSRVTSTGTQTWDTLITPYLRDTQVFACPGDSVKRPFRNGKRSYSINDQIAFWQLKRTGIPSTHNQGMKLSSITSLSQYVLMSEWHDANNVVGANTCQVRYYHPVAPSDFYHNSGSNFLFFDGHVDYMIMGDPSLPGAFTINGVF